jgi:murein DD-endopeptidase MepM/ murein hydrolase activator NlpD
MDSPAPSTGHDAEIDGSSTGTDGVGAAVPVLPSSDSSSASSGEVQNVAAITVASGAADAQQPEGDALVAGSGLLSGHLFAPVVKGLKPGNYLVRDFTRGWEGIAALADTGFSFDVGRYNERRRAMCVQGARLLAPSAGLFRIPLRVGPRATGRRQGREGLGGNSLLCSGGGARASKLFRRRRLCPRPLLLALAPRYTSSLFGGESDPWATVAALPAPAAAAAAAPAATAAAPSAAASDHDDAGAPSGGSMVAADPRDIHMGIDIGAAVGTPVYAAADGVVHSVGYNPAELDYGHVIVTEHVLACKSGSGDDSDGDGVCGGESRRVWMLYGHLSAESTAGKIAGCRVARGEVLGWMGDVHENGGWPPHVHFQLSMAEPRTHDLPGVVSTAQHADALARYPDPRMVLGRLYEGDALFE